MPYIKHFRQMRDLSVKDKTVQFTLILENIFQDLTVMNFLNKAQNIYMIEESEGQGCSSVVQCIIICARPWVPSLERGQGGEKKAYAHHTGVEELQQT